MGRFSSMDEPAFNQVRFGLRHVIAILIHIPLSVLLFWMMAEARVAGAFNIVWLFFAFLVFIPAIAIAASCIEPWLQGASEMGGFRILLFIDCAVSAFPTLYIGWLTAWYMLGSWPQFFKVPFQLYSLTTFFESIGGGLLIIFICGLYSWVALRLMYLLVFRRGEITSEDVLGDLAGPPAIDLPVMAPQDDILSPDYVPPPVKRAPTPTSSLPRKLAQPTSFDERQARIRAVRGIAWPGSDADTRRAREAGFALLEWNLWHGEAAPGGDALSAFSVLHGLAHLAPTMSREEAELAALQLRGLFADTRQPFTDERAADGVPALVEEIRERNRTAPSVGDLARRVYSHVLGLHPGLEGRLPRP
ncbi:MAG: hypothetical protein SF172_04635 [Burkholderiales bacterium]|nr:hypothetical protein [Burkholderiales bacterium]